MVSNSKKHFFFKSRVDCCNKTNIFKRILKFLLLKLKKKNKNLIKTSINNIGLTIRFLSEILSYQQVCTVKNEIMNHFFFKQQTKRKISLSTKKMIYLYIPISTAFPSVYTDMDS